MDRLTRGLWLLAGVALGAFLLFFAYRSGSVLLAPFQVEYGEGPVLAWARTLATGQLPYKPIDPFPWSFSVYTPGYLAGAALGLRLAPGMPWLGGRGLSLLAALGLAALLVAVGRGRTRGSIPTVMALLWLSSPYVFRWATFYRPDLFALGWSALGIVLVRRAVAQERRALLWLAAGCFVASFWSKQSFFAAPLAATLFLAWRRRDWLPHLVGAGAAGGALVAAGLWLGAGDALVADLIAANANPFAWGTLWRFQRSFFSVVPVLALLATLAVIRLPSSRPPRPHAARNTAPDSALLPLYLILSLLVTLSVGKAGAWENYFLEPLWVMLALAGQTLLHWQRRGGGWTLAVPALVLLQLALFVPGFERRTPAAEAAWLAERRAEDAALQAALAPLPPDALVWSEQMGVLAETGRPVPLHSFVYTQLARQGLWDEAALTERLAAGEGARLVQRADAVADPLRRDRWSRAMLDAGERGWALGERAGDWRVRPPRPFPRPDESVPLSEAVSLVNWMVLHDGTPLAPPVELVPGDTLDVHALWRSARRLRAPLTVSWQLFDPAGERVAQDDAPLRGGLGGAWPEGALVRDEHSLALPAALAPGAYTLQATLYESESGAPLGSLSLERLKVSLPPPDGRLAVAHAARFGDGMRLLAHDPLPDTVAPGETVTWRARWALDEATAQPLTTFLHLVAPDGRLVAQRDVAPLYPPAVWSPGEVVEVRYELTLPDAIGTDEVEWRLGWYDPMTLERLPARDTTEVEGALRLGVTAISE